MGKAYSSFKAHYKGKSAEIWAADKDSAREKAGSHFKTPRNDRNLIIIVPTKEKK